jgi:hypothetical protein
MTTRKPNDQARANAPVADRPVPKPAPQPSQADQAHIATAGYWREQQAAIDRIAKLKAARLAQDGGNVKPAKPKAKPEAVVQSPGPTQDIAQPPLARLTDRGISTMPGHQQVESSP